jgi:hypothetical protein
MNYILRAILALFLASIASSVSAEDRVQIRLPTKAEPVLINGRTVTLKSGTEVRSAMQGEAYLKEPGELEEHLASKGYRLANGAETTEYKERVGQKKGTPPPRTKIILVAKLPSNEAPQKGGK